ncbi:MAG: dihydrodipicolinate synthase family protein [Chloroflexota bacterium]
MPALGRGAYGILLTTYTEQDTVDHDDLHAQADFVAGAAQGIVWPVLASEFFLLSLQEIAAGFPVVTKGAAGRVPFVAGVSALTTGDAVALTEAAAHAGADAVIVMPPFIKKASGSRLLSHFEAIAEVGLLIVVQNTIWLAGAGTLTVDELRLLADKIPRIRYLKEEAPVLPQTLSRVIGALPGVFEHVFGGGGGRFLIDELGRGGSGTMLACEWADLFGTIAVTYDRGDVAEARRLHAAALAGVNLETAYGMAGAREVLRDRGVIRSTRSRYGADQELDAAALTEIHATVEQLRPLLRGRHSTHG